jgi:hypothetical protein
LGACGLFEGSKTMPKFLLIVSALAAALGLAAIPAAHASNPKVIHFPFSFTEVLDDFCGTGMTVNEVGTGHATVWLAPKQPVDSRKVNVEDDVFTNPLNGATVSVHTAFQFSDTLISGDPNGLNTHEWVFKGAAEVIRSADGRVLGSGPDAGYLVVHATWSGPEFTSELIGAEIVTDHGGHPLFMNDCSVLIPALGLG